MRVWLSLGGCRESQPSSSPPPTDASTPAAATAQLDEALRLGDPYARAEALGKLLPTLDPAALPLVKDTLGNFRAELGPVEFDLLLRFWANQDPEEALMWTFRFCPTLYRLTATRTTMEILAQRDPLKAADQLDSMAIDSDEMSRVAQIALDDVFPVGRVHGQATRTVILSAAKDLARTANVFERSLGPSLRSG